MINVPLTSGTLALHKITGDIQAGPSNATWAGRLQGDEPGGMTLVAKNGQVTGTLTSPEGMYRILPLGDGHQALVKLDASKFPADEPPDFINKNKNKNKNLFKPTQADTTKTGPVEINVLVAYTPSAKAAINATGDLDSTLKLAVLEANQSYQNSKISIKLKFVDNFELPLIEGSDSFDQILAKFVANATVKQHRIQSGADLQVLIINKKDYCGLADGILADKSTAFAIVHYNCATGYYSFAHELGHLMGARHDEQSDPSSQPFPYGHGYRDHNKWRTIMAYPCPQSCNRLQYWSNPNITFGGEPMGTALINDNARVLNQTASSIASFHK
jgi:hypothetical protein